VIHCAPLVPLCLTPLVFAAVANAAAPIRMIRLLLVRLRVLVSTRTRMTINRMLRPRLRTAPTRAVVTLTPTARIFTPTPRVLPLLRTRLRLPACSRAWNSVSDGNYEKCDGNKFGVSIFMLDFLTRSTCMFRSG